MKNEINKHDLFSAFKTELTALAPEGARFKVALSGGLDSVVLLHLFSRLDYDNISAQHVHHGLSNNADSWAKSCRKFSHALNINCIVSKVTLDKKNRISLEALARDKRYTILKEGMTENSYLVTAHHQDDQLETVLLALKRGAGLTGLQGIVAKQCLDKGYLIRPLLNFSREQLEYYAQQFSLQWIEDESNDDQRFDRNFIRHTITPLLKARWSGITKTVARSASHCQSQQLLIDEITETDFQRCLFKQQVLNVETLKQLSETRLKNVLRRWFKKAELNYPSSKQLTALWQNIALAQADAEPKMQLQEHFICRYRGLLYLIDNTKLALLPEKITWQGEQKLVFLDGKIAINISYQADFLKQSHHVEICFRKDFASDFKCQPLGRDKRRSIKKLLHEYHVPPWQRDNVPFIFIDGILVEAVGLWKCETAFTELFHTSLS